MTSTENAEPRSWDMFAGIRGTNDGPEYANFYTNRNLVRMHGHETIYPVRLVEDPEGRLLGWLDFGHPERAVALIEHERIFEIQFPYGSAGAAERGLGEVVRLRAEPIEEVS